MVKRKFGAAAELGQLALPDPVSSQRRYRRTRRLAAMMAPAAAHGGAVIDDPEAFEIVEAVVSLYLSTDAPEGMTRAEITTNLVVLGFDPPAVEHRLDVLLQLGAINRYLDKARHHRYILDLATVAGVLFLRKGLERGGIEELLSFLRKTSAELAGDSISQETVEQVLVDVRGLIGLWTAEVNRLVGIATSDELHGQRGSHDDRRLMEEVSRLTALVADRFNRLGDLCGLLLRAAQDYVEAVGRLIDRVLMEAAQRRDFSLLSPEDYLTAARLAPVNRLAAATTGLVWDVPAVFAPGSAVAAALRDFVPASSRTRRRPAEPPALDLGDPLERIEQRRDRRREQLERTAELLLQGRSEADITSALRSQGWPTAARTVAQLSTLRQHRGSRYSVELKDSLIVDPDGPLTYTTPVTLYAHRPVIKPESHPVSAEEGAR
jgi:hypothetical protein